MIAEAQEFAINAAFTLFAFCVIMLAIKAFK